MYINKKLLFVVIVVMALISAYFLLVSNPAVVEAPIACTADAKLCPDGSAVGRVGPNCEFAECPL